MSVSANAFDGFACARDARLSSGLGGRPVITSLKVSKNDDSKQRVEVADVTLNKIFEVEFEPESLLKITDKLHCVHSGLFGKEQLLMVVTADNEAYNRNVGSTTLLHVYKYKAESQGYERVRIVKLVNPEGLTAAKLFVSNGSLYMVMNEGSVGRVVYRLLVNELGSDEL